MPGFLIKSFPRDLHQRLGKRAKQNRRSMSAEVIVILEDVLGRPRLETAIHHDIPAHDSQFVVLAEDLGAELVTADRRLVGACPDVAVTPRRFLGGRA